MAKTVVIVDVFVPQRDAEDPLRQKIGQTMPDPIRITAVFKAPGHPSEQIKPPRHITQQ